MSCKETCLRDLSIVYRLKYHTGQLINPFCDASSEETGVTEEEL